MKDIVPGYYSKFHCIAQRCRHCCCIGWEIDIDQETLAAYDTVPGELGERLKTHISREETPHFLLGEGERCPFLNSQGLCDLIIGLGEASLCQICTDHPRFRNEFSDHTEIGLGLCCEAAGQLILSERTPMELIVLSDDGEDEGLWEDEWELLKLRNDVFSLLRDRSRPISRRVTGMLELCGASLPNFSVQKWAEEYLALERLDEEWTQQLTSLYTYESADQELPVDDTLWEQLVTYFVYRHFPAALVDGDLSSKAGFAAVSYQLIRWLAEMRYMETGHLTLDDIVDISRMYSGEIEYSDENLEILFALLGNA